MAQLETSHWSHWSHWLRVAMLAWLSAAGCQGVDAGMGAPGGDGSAMPPVPDGAMSMPDGPAPKCAPQVYFEEQAYPQVFSVCAGCHVPGGQSGGTRFVLKPAGAPDAVASDFAIAGQAARTLTQGGESLILTKPTGQVAHGGGTVIPMSGAQLGILKEMVRQFLDPALAAACGTNTQPALSGVSLMDPGETLRKASLQLAGRIPTDQENAAALAGDPMTLSGLDAPLLTMMSEPAFDDRLKEMWNDLLLTDKNRFEQGYEYLTVYGVPDSLRAAAYCNNVNYQNYDERVKTQQARTCIQSTDSLAREPLEMIAHVVRANRPFSEILTAQYRLFNVFEATVFGLDLAPYNGHTDDPSYFVETRFPAMHGPKGLAEEYAGVVTTNSFLFRYNSTGSNRNRGRAHHFYKFFLGKDVMKSAPRLDLSTVDLTKSPWRYDPQCTGCHAAIDPVAGAFQHWTNCYDIAQVQYYDVRYCGMGGWYPEKDMYAPGVGMGDASKLSPQQLPTALAFLAQSTIMDPAFSRAVAQHVLSSLTGHDLLTAPSDPMSPDYPAMDAAYEAQQKSIDALSAGFSASNFDFKKLVIAVVKSPAFRAQNADKENRLELSGLGGGSLSPPEILHRKIAAIVGAPWSVKGGASDPAPGLRDPPFYLSSLGKFRLFAGGIDSNGVQSRARTPSSLTTSVVQRMALETACHYTAHDFALDRAQRHLFVRVDRALVPSGDPNGQDQKPILDEIVYLHDRILGETLATADPEILATYQLLSNLQKQGAAAVAMNKAPPALLDECSAKVDWATAMPLPMNQQFTADPSYVVRAWQGVIAYLLMDYRFAFEQ